ncbi:pseudaminic acid cytidylyltransferase [Sphingobacterium sp. HMA12]|uniref:pseudaminic acid cytidylyltransferase n=1 Tax=Sphingobacterium sp. HMA12 TaxID=2050894 RepID=UPI000CE9B976|nr:pseudaminic acid cytidylyltransferase [Sphingobacterium sp. HMA12]
MKNICIIPARGGSKRIPRKNIRNFLGKPIIAYSIEAALNSGVFAEVMVSTDDLEIATIANQYGAKTPFLRSSKNSDDYASTTSVIKEVLANYAAIDVFFDGCCCIYPTAPFIVPGNLVQANRLLVSGAADLVMTVVAYSFPIQRSLIINSSQTLAYKYPDQRLMRSQDLEPIYHDAGQFYFFLIKQFEARDSIMSDRAVPLIRSELDVQDIDNESDWMIAELKMKLRSAHT